MTQTSSLGGMASQREAIFICNTELGFIPGSLRTGILHAAGGLEANPECLQMMDADKRHYSQASDFVNSQLTSIISSMKTRNGILLFLSSFSCLR
jgi:hypothetical protein